MVAFLTAFFWLMTVGSKVEATATDQPPVQPIVYETVSILVECRTANLTVTSAVSSGDSGLVHFPSGIDMNAVDWENVTGVNVGFSRGFCFLTFSFENVDNNTARSIADGFKDDFERVFGVSYTYESTEVDDNVTINYVASGVANLPQRTQWLIENCLAQNLGGFSMTFVPMTSELTAITILSATKPSGSFDWEYGMAIMYAKGMSPGTGIHTIDVLELLHVNSLEPSPYSDLSVAGGSVQIYGNVTFVDCEPAQTQEPGGRGWYIMPFPGGILWAMFGFGGNSTPFNELWLKFSGVVIPEFTAPTLTAAIILISSAAITLKKQLKHINN